MMPAGAMGPPRRAGDTTVRSVKRRSFRTDGGGSPAPPWFGSPVTALINKLAAPVAGGCGPRPPPRTGPAA